MHGFVSEDGQGGLIAAGEGNSGSVSAGKGGRIPEEFAGGFVEGDSRLVCIEEESVADDHGCGGESPGGHGCFCLGGEIGGPPKFTVGFIPAGNEALFAEGVEPFSFDDGRRVGSARVVFWDEVLGVGLAPQGFSCSGVEALDEVISFEVSEGVGAVFADGDAGVSEVDFGRPENLGAGGGPFVGPTCFVVKVAVAVRSAPITLAGGERKGSKGEGGDEVEFEHGRKRLGSEDGE